MKGHIILTRQTFFLLLIGCLVSLSLIVNFVHQVAAKEARNSESDEYRYLKTFTDVLALVEKNYVEEADFKEMVEGAIKGMLLSLDPHSSYMNEELYKELQVETKGKFGGLGIEITIKDGLLTVVSPIEDSPASRAGVRAGDQIIKIGDEFTKDLSLIEAVKKMRGPKGTPITISVHREKATELLAITIIRDIIKVKSVRYRMLESCFGYIRLAQFQEKSSREFQAGLDQLQSKSPGKKLCGLVYDMRNNPGGLLTEAIKISELFLTDGIIVYTDGRLESQKQKYFAHDDGTEPEYPIIVLINGGSASASEIVAGSLQDTGRALVLGEQSFGKGSVQTILPMDNGGALRLTTALYFTESGRSIQAQGITPDIEVSSERYPSDGEELLEEDELLPIREKDLPGALQPPSGKGKKSKKPRQRSKKKVKDDDRLAIGSRSAMEADLARLLHDDPQLDQALRYLKAFKVFERKPAVQAKRQDKLSG